MVGFIMGRFLDEMTGMRFGHADAIVEEGELTTADKSHAVRATGVTVADRQRDIPALVHYQLGSTPIDAHEAGRR